jgi:hypothetical protein
MFAACIASFSTLKMEAIQSSKPQVNFYQTARHHVPEDGKGKGKDIPVTGHGGP